MGLFDGKPRVTFEEYCKYYYDSQIFPCLTDSQSDSQIVYDTVFKSMTEAEPSFSKINRNLFNAEMAAMHLELFALAFYKRFPDFNNAVKQRIYTFRYLEKIGEIELWEAIGEYSATLAKTAKNKPDGSEPVAGPPNQVEQTRF